MEFDIQDRVIPAWPKDRNPVNICFATNENYVKPLSVSLFSLIQNAEKNRWYDILILTGKISENSKKLLSSLALEFPQISIRLISMEKYRKLLQAEVTGYLSIETYYRLFLLSDLFSEYDKMLYLDCDTLVLDDMSGMFDTDLAGKKAGAVEAYYIKRYLFFQNPVVVNHKFYSADTYCKIVIGLNGIQDYFNAGMVLMNLKELRKTISMEQIFSMVQKNQFKFHDQDILNSIVHGDFVRLPVRYNYQNCYEAVRLGEREELKEVMKDAFCENPAVIHYVSQKKPWNEDDVVLKYVYDSYVNRMK